MKAVFAGHSAVFVHLEGFVAVIDPWLQENPSCPPNLKDPSKLDLIILTHGHSDHAGDVLRLQKQTGAKVVAVYELAQILVEEGVPSDLVIGMNKGGTVTVGPLKVTLTHAEHSSSFDSQSRGTLYAGEACGVVVSDGEHTFVHTGDTLLFSDMHLTAEIYRPTLGFIPIGGHFTMSAKEAAMAAHFLGVKVAVPIHFQTFPVLADSAKPFISACREYGIQVTELAPGEAIEIP